MGAYNQQHAFDCRCLLCRRPDRRNYAQRSVDVEAAAAADTVAAADAVRRALNGEQWRDRTPPPAHYAGTLEPWEVIIAWGLNFFSGNVVKYIRRYQQKGGVEDLRKARDYIDELIRQHAPPPTEAPPKP